MKVGPTPGNQVFCPHCQGGNPRAAARCLWCGWPLRKPLSRRARWVLTLIGALILLPVLAWSLSYQLQSGATVPSRATAPTEPVEYQLAFLNSNGAAARDDVSVFRFRYLLDSIHRKTGESYTALADATVTTQQACHSRYGRDVKLLDLMEAGNKAVQLPGGPASYGEALAAILVVSCSE